MTTHRAEMFKHLKDTKHGNVIDLILGKANKTKNILKYGMDIHLYVHILNKMRALFFLEIQQL